MNPTIETMDALFLDFDGTLAEIAGSPAAVQVAPEVPVLLNDLLDRLGGAVAVVSGRDLDELADLLSPYRGPMAGVHGLERRRANGRIIRPDPVPVLQHARKTLTAFAAATSGVELEDKGIGFALHFRANPEKGFACLQLAQEIAWLSGRRLAVTQAKMVVELHPVGANKGRAILDFLSEPPFRGRRPVYIGDDRPDESGFLFVNHMNGLSILVGSNPTSAAQFSLRDVDGVLNWLSHAKPGLIAPRFSAAS
jgi:trehalose 6-phosphate phosphatase